MIQKGDKVVMHSCDEAFKHNGKIWTCRTDEYERHGERLVFLKNYSGCFPIEYLQKVYLKSEKRELLNKLNEQQEKLERLKEQLDCSVDAATDFFDDKSFYKHELEKAKREIKHLTEENIKLKREIKYLTEENIKLKRESKHYNKKQNVEEEKNDVQPEKYFTDKDNKKQKKESRKQALEEYFDK
ncbi:hypothetical protein [Cytobacillus sp. IB215316]|uniref:hypothetical protein n=1 Tax=Cytobacillus sp. IB215316 TaxID=3097354 RepID=UPI002A1731A6|nr:hypothetical protein [Cytobacillus sp. IB215316]MDX8359617.1 hypothetical protein [Cytobacillus sp. IB215316]